MTMPKMVPFTDEDALTIQRLEKAGPYEYFQPKDQAFTFKINGITMACVGYERFSNFAIAWMILAKDARNHPGVFWAIREMLETSSSMVGTMYIGVRKDWDKANRFAKWLKFAPTGDHFEANGYIYLLYVRS